MKKIKSFMCVLISALLFCTFNNAYATELDIDLDLQKINEVRIGIIDTGINDEYFSKEHIGEGKNYAFEGESTKDLLGHGTSIASLILDDCYVKAISDDKCYSNSNIVLIPLVYQSKYPSGVIKNSGVEGLCKAIYDAIDIYKCKILCISSGIDTDDEMLFKAIEYAENQGVIVVAAVGNDNLSSPDKVFYPAAYETVIGVGAIDEKNNIAKFSQNSSVSVVALGVDINTMDNKGDKKVVSGTSYSAAIVTGIFARLKQVYKNLTPQELRDILSTVSLDLGEKGFDDIYGFGAVDLDAYLIEINELIEGDKKIEIEIKKINYSNIVYL